MATYVCPVDPISVWVPLDPTIKELPEAPTKTTNPSAVPANTLPGTFNPNDFLLTEDNYGSVAGQGCVVDDWSLITSAVSVSLDYESILTIWDTLPTDTPLIPAKEIDTTILYPSYREYTVQEQVAFTVCEVQSVRITVVELALDPVVSRTYARIYAPLLGDISGVVYAQAVVQEIGGNVYLTATAVCTVDSATLNVAGTEYGYTLS
jgi:hypothetical protein